MNKLDQRIKRISYILNHVSIDDLKGVQNCIDKYNELLVKMVDLQTDEAKYSLTHKVNSLLVDISEHQKLNNLFDLFMKYPEINKKTVKDDILKHITPVSLKQI